jgi:hypothetical protein
MPALGEGDRWRGAEQSGETLGLEDCTQDRKPGNQEATHEYRIRNQLQTVTGILPGASGIQRIQDAKHALDHIAPRKWKRETKGAELDIRQATASYETWLRGCTTVVE